MRAVSISASHPYEVRIGSGLLSEGLADGSVVTIPLLGKTSVHLGWIHIRSSRPSPLTEQFVRLLEEALADSTAFTRRLPEGTSQRSKIPGASGRPVLF